MTASEIIDTIEVRQLTSPLFSQEREVSAGPHSVCGSQAASSSQRQQAFSNVVKPVRDTDLLGMGKPVRGVESFSHVEWSLSNGKRNRELESVQLSQMDKEKILSEQRSLHEYVEKNAERAFQS